MTNSSPHTRYGYEMPAPYRSGIGWTVNDGAFGYFYGHELTDVYDQWDARVDSYVERSGSDEYVDTREGWRLLGPEGDRTSAFSVRTQDHWVTEHRPDGTTRTWVPFGGDQ